MNLTEDDGRINNQVEFLELMECRRMLIRVGMSLGLDKCRKLHLSRGEVITSLEADDRDLIQTMIVAESYGYLGVFQARGPLQSAMREALKTSFTRRLNSIVPTGLSARNITKVINTFAILLLTYSFGSIEWSKTDLEVTQLRECFLNRTNILLYDYICRVDLCAPLKLAVADFQNIEHLTVEHPNAQWRGKQLHGKHPQTLDLPCVNTNASNLWLKRGELSPEPEGFVIAIEDGVMNTRKYQKHVSNIEAITDKFRLCGNPNETIEHIIDGCTMLASQEYTRRHNHFAGIIHQQISLNLGLLEESEPYHKYVPVSVLENEHHLLYWDRTILTDHLAKHNRPDVLWWNKRDDHVRIIDISVSLNKNIQLRYTEKIQKYAELRQEIMTLWRVKKVSLHPVVVSSTGNVHARCIQHLEVLGAGKFFYLIQKAILLNTCRIARSFLGVNNNGG